MSAAKPVPVIDWQAGAALPSEARAELDRACRESGFFYLRNHGMETQMSEVWDQVRWFFSLPPQDKQSVARSEENSRGYYDRELTKNTRDMKEVFDFGPHTRPDLPEDDPANRTQDGWNQWPQVEGGQAFRQVMQAYFDACYSVGLEVLTALATNLGVAPSSLSRAFGAGHSSFLRLNYYPVRDPLAGTVTQRADATGHMGVHHHTDAGALTLLLQDEVGGLQILHDDTWLDVPPLPGTLVVNIGDIVQVWSNDGYMAPLHRVVASSRRDRFSIPFFLNPAYTADYAPLEAVVGQGSPHYRPINWGEFRFHRQHGDYGDYGNEIQISDFRLPMTGP